jgi:hypothetical protein
MTVTFGDSHPLGFLSPARCERDVLASPLRRALEGVDPAVVEDLSLQGVIEARGDVSKVIATEDEEVVRLSSRRALVFTNGGAADVVERLRDEGLVAYDLTGGYAGFAVTGERLMRRLTDLDLDALPTAGPFARVPAIVMRHGDRFRVYVPQELGHDVVGAVLDALEGLE